MNNINKLEKNIIVHMTWLHKAVPQMSVSEYTSCVLSDSDLPSDTFNTIYVTGSANADRDLKEAVEHFRKRDLPFALWIGQHVDAESQIPEWTGLAPVEVEPALTLDLTDWQVRPSKSALKVRPVQSQNELLDFAKCLASLSDPPDAVVLEFYRRSSEALFEASCPLHLFTGYLDGEPVATCEVCVVEDIAGIFAVTTRREYQRRGFALAMLNAGLQAALAKGCDLAGLTASAEGLPVYERLGFQVCGSYTVFQ